MAEDLLSGQKLHKIIHKIVKQKMDSKMSEQHHHQEKKRIYDVQQKQRGHVKRTEELGL